MGSGVTVFSQVKGFVIQSTAPKMSHSWVAHRILRILPPGRGTSPGCLVAKGLATMTTPVPRPPKRSPSKRSLRRSGRTPSMSTIWEWAGGDTAIDAVPSTEVALQGGGSAVPARGSLWLRPSGIFPLRLFSRRHFLPRFAVLLPANGVVGKTGPPRLQLFLVRRERGLKGCLKGWEGSPGPTAPLHACAIFFSSPPPRPATRAALTHCALCSRPADGLDGTTQRGAGAALAAAAALPAARGRAHPLLPIRQQRPPH